MLLYLNTREDLVFSSWSWKSSTSLWHLTFLLGFRVGLFSFFFQFKQHESQDSSEVCYKYTYLSLKYRGAGLEQGNYDSPCKMLLHLYYQRQIKKAMKHNTHQVLLMLRQQLTCETSQSKLGDCYQGIRNPLRATKNQEYSQSNGSSGSPSSSHGHPKASSFIVAPTTSLRYEHENIRCQQLLPFL